MQESRSASSDRLSPEQSRGRRRQRPLSPQQTIPPRWQSWSSDQLAEQRPRRQRTPSRGQGAGGSSSSPPPVIQLGRGAPPAFISPSLSEVTLGSLLAPPSEANLGAAANPAATRHSPRPSVGANTAAGPSRATASSTGASGSRSRAAKVRLRIETGFSIEARNKDLDYSSLVEKFIAQFGEWRMVGEECVRRNQGPCGSLSHPKQSPRFDRLLTKPLPSKGEFAMVSPFLDMSDSTWRNAVVAAWERLSQHCRFSVSNRWGTHIHILRDPMYETREIKRIVASIIYFEPAFETLVPRHLRGNKVPTKSNWVHGPDLAQEGRSRLQSIRHIEAASDMIGILSSIQEFQDEEYNWNFWNLIQESKTIEFRQPPACLTSDDTLAWTELFLNFIQAATLHGDLHRLETFAQHIGGLRSFLRLVQLPRVHEPHRLQRLWADKGLHAAEEPSYSDLGNVLIGRQQQASVMGLISADWYLIKKHPAFGQWQ